MLEIKNLTFEYFNQSVFHNIDLSILPGQVMHIKGANGAGKSTLLKCISGLLSPTAGDISYQEQSIQFSNNFQQHLCYIGHKLGINLSLSPKENIYYNYLDKVSAEQEINALTTLKLKEIADTPCIQLSMGQKKRTSLLRLFLTRAAIWLLDEPFVGLDVETVSHLTKLIAKHVEAGGIVLITSHQQLDFSSNYYREFIL